MFRNTLRDRKRRRPEPRGYPFRLSMARMLSIYRQPSTKINAWCDKGIVSKLKENPLLIDEYSLQQRDWDVGGKRSSTMRISSRWYYQIAIRRLDIVLKHYCVRRVVHIGRWRQRWTPVSTITGWRKERQQNGRIGQPEPETAVPRARKNDDDANNDESSADDTDNDDESSADNPITTSVFYILLGEAVLAPPTMMRALPFWLSGGRSGRRWRE